MALFQTEGWNLDTVVKKGRSKESTKAKNKKRKNDEIASLSKSNELNNNNDKEIRPTKKTKVKPSKSHKVKESVTDGPADSTQTEQVTEEITKPVEAPTLDLPSRAKLTPLQQKMMAKLTGSRFRWINEQLYTISSNEALKLVREQPTLFDEYHEGFRSQVQSWPENPVDVFVNQIKQRAIKPVNAPGGLPGLQKNKKIVIADMGCGEAQFSLDISNYLKQKNNKKGKRNNGLDIQVHSFDLKKANERITVADIKNVPLPDESCTIVIFCLALMGTNFLDFIKEAYRILAPRGELWIAEIKSRFGEKDGEGEEFTKALKLQGFFHKKTDSDNKMFTRFEFFKAPAEIIAERKAKLERKQKFIEHEDEKEELESKRLKTPEGKWLLKPCIYKRR